jgi:hypothetical protein
MSTYPASIDNGSSLPVAIDGLTPVQGSVFNALRNATLAIETTLGPQPAGVYGSVAGRLTTLEGSVGNIQSISLAGDLGGSLATPLVIGIQGRPVSSATPNSGQVLAWNGAAWVPGTASSVPIIFSGDLLGSPITQTVVGIQGVAVSSTVPTSGQVLGYDGTEYVPITLSGVFIAGGDLSGTPTSQTVIGLRGRPVLSTAPTTGQDLQWNGSAWAPATPASGFTAGGDLTGSSTSQQVISVAHVTTGVLSAANQAAQTMGGAVGGTTAASTINLTGNSFITGSLPTANQVAQSLTLTGDVTGSGTTAGTTTTIAKIQGVVISGTPSNGYVLTATSSTAADWQAISSGSVTLAGDVTGAANSNTVASIQGVVISGTPSTGQVLEATTSTAAHWATPASGFTAGGDLSGTPTSQTVIGIDNVPLSITSLTTNQILQYNGTDWVNVAIPSGFTAGGDLTGSSTSQTVAKIDGASVPAAGSLTTGNVLQVTGASALSYAPVNLAGGSNYVTGALPNGNQAAQSLTLVGDTTGSGTTATTTTTTVKINGASVPAAGSLTTGNGLYVTGASALSYSALNLAGGSNYVTGALPNANQAPQTMGGDVTGTTAVSTVVALQGNAVSSATPTTGYVLEWNGSAWAPTSSLPTSPVQGDIIYYNGTAWVNLATGTAGQVLTTEGASANPQWTTITGLPASPAQGDIAYYNGTSWVNLAPGTSGQFLKTLGASANPAWATVPASPGGTSIGTYASRPAAGTAGNRYLSTDGAIEFVDNGTAWQPILDGTLGTQPPAAASFTGSFLNSGTTISDVKGSVVLSAVYTVGTQVQSAQISLGSYSGTGYTLTAAFKANILQTSASPGFGIGVTDGTKLVFERSIWENTNQVVNFNSATSYNGNTFTPSPNFQTGLNAHTWMRIQWVAGGSPTRNWYVSADGINWAFLGSTTGTAFLTETSCFFFADTNASAMNVQVMLESWHLTFP